MPEFMYREATPNAKYFDNFCVKAKSSANSFGLKSLVFCPELLVNSMFPKLK